MVAISVDIEGQEGLTWPLWQRWVAEVERLDFFGLYRSDHLFTLIPPDLPVLELIVSLTYLADHSHRLRFGPMVSPLSFRDPVMLARQAIALDDLSGGRMVLGVGTGWYEREHQMFGYQLGDTRTRLDRLEEGLEVLTRLLRSDEPVTFDGRFYHLRDAILLPRPQRPAGPPIMIGGRGPRRTLPLVARYADIWNVTRLTPTEVHERSALLDDLLKKAGREPRAVRRTVTRIVFCGRNETELAQRMRRMRQLPEASDLSVTALVEMLRSRFRAIVGPPEYVAEQIAAYADAGVEEFVLQWVDVADFEGIQVIAEEVLPRLQPAAGRSPQLL